MSHDQCDWKKVTATSLLPNIVFFFSGLPQILDTAPVMRVVQGYSGVRCSSDTQDSCLAAGWPVLVEGSVSLLLKVHVEQM